MMKRRDINMQNSQYVKPIHRIGIIGTGQGVPSVEDVDAAVSWGRDFGGE
jgi:hypothetical protein